MITESWCVNLVTGAQQAQTYERIHSRSRCCQMVRAAAAGWWGRGWETFWALCPFCCTSVSVRAASEGGLRVLRGPVVRRPAALYVPHQRPGGRVCGGANSSSDSSRKIVVLCLVSSCCVQTLGENAPSQLILYHYPDLKEEKGLVFMTAEMDPKFMVSRPRGPQHGAITAPRRVGTDTQVPAPPSRPSPRRSAWPIRSSCSTARRGRRRTDWLRPSTIVRLSSNTRW